MQQTTLSKQHFQIYVLQAFLGFIWVKILVMLTTKQYSGLTLAQIFLQPTL